MARPVGADAETTRKRVLESAAVLFAQKGEGQTSMRQIAGGAGVSLGTVHHYFGSKARLYDACIEAMYEKLGEMRVKLAERVVEAGDPKSVLEEAMRTAFRFTREHQSAVRLIMRDVVDVGEVDPERRARFVAPSLDQAVVLLESILGWPKLEVRLMLQSLINTVGRDAISTEAELAHMTGLAESDALQATEDHLVGLAWTMTKLDL